MEPPVRFNIVPIEKKGGWFRLFYRRELMPPVDRPSLVCRFDNSLAIPPAAAQRLKQRCGIGKTAGLRLDAGDQRLLICLLRRQQTEVLDLTQFQLASRNIQ